MDQNRQPVIKVVHKVDNVETLTLLQQAGARAE